MCVYVDTHTQPHTHTHTLYCMLVCEPSVGRRQTNGPILGLCLLEVWGQVRNKKVFSFWALTTCCSINLFKKKHNCFTKELGLEKKDYSTLHVFISATCTFECAAPPVCIHMTTPESYLGTNLYPSCRYLHMNAQVCVRSRLRNAPRSIINTLFNTPDLSLLLLW